MAIGFFGGSENNVNRGGCQMAWINNIITSFKDLKWYEWAMTVIMIAIAGMAAYEGFTDPDSANPGWLTVVNFISALCGVVCIFFTAKASLSNFPFAIINTTTYIIYLGYWHIWGTFALELLVYFPINFISWYIWSKHRDEEEGHLTKSKKLPTYANIAIGIGLVVFAAIAHSILVKIHGEVPWLDAFTLSIGLVAIVLQMLRYREQYVLWIITDVIAVAMFIEHFDAVYLTKKSIYLIVAVIGLMNWIKLNKTRNTSNE